MTKLQEGKRYRIRYKMQSGNYRWYEWESTCTYIGLGGPDGEQLAFSYRPLGGTGWISPESLVSAEYVGVSVPHKHPKRFKGAVEAP